MTWVILAAVAVVASPRSADLKTRRRRRSAATSGELAEICDLAAICLTGGLNIATALRIAADTTGGAIATEVRKILAIARIDGLSQAMATAEGNGARLYRTVSRTDATGGPMLQSVQALADELWAEQAAAAVEKARKLPVAMLLPLTLLILPGFLLLTIAPAVMEAFSRLSL
jgi:pilus assembly protein TadC